MCYSPEASFIVGAGLIAVGTYTLMEFHSKEEFKFAAIPMLFGIQQVSEGFVWIGLQHPGTSWANIGVYAQFVFLFFAFCFWPIWISRSLIPLESNPRTKKFLKFIATMGFIIALYLVYLTILNGGVPATVCNHHIAYNLQFSHMRTLEITFTLYIACVAMPFLLSSVKETKILGFMVLLSAVAISYIYMFDMGATSLWCFWCAVFSLIVYHILQTRNTVTEQVEGRISRLSAH